MKSFLLVRVSLLGKVSLLGLISLLERVSPMEIVSLLETVFPLGKVFLLGKKYLLGSVFLLGRDSLLGQVSLLRKKSSLGGDCFIGRVPLSWRFLIRNILPTNCETFPSWEEFFSRDCGLQPNVTLCATANNGMGKLSPESFKWETFPKGNNVGEFVKFSPLI